MKKILLLIILTSCAVEEHKEGWVKVSLACDLAMSSYENGYAEGQLAALRVIKHGLDPDELHKQDSIRYAESLNDLRRDID